MNDQPKSTKKHTFCIMLQKKLLSLQQKYDKSYSYGDWKSHKRKKGFAGYFSARSFGLFRSGHIHSEGFRAW